MQEDQRRLNGKKKIRELNEAQTGGVDKEGVEVCASGVKSNDLEKSQA
jgi:hypothetical protein